MYLNINILVEFPLLRMNEQIIVTFSISRWKSGKEISHTKCFLAFFFLLHLCLCVANVQAYMGLSHCVCTCALICTRWQICLSSRLESKVSMVIVKQ